MSWEAAHAAGREAAYAEIYATLDDLDHPRHCDGCRPCGVMKASLEWAMRSLSSNLGQDDFYALAGILARVETAAAERWRDDPLGQISQCGAEIW